MSRHILVTTNNFWVGGRETYVATYASALADRSVTADLLCSSVQPGLPEATIFRATGVAGERAGSPDLRSWLETGARLVAERRPALIWAQHFDLLPAWLLANLHGIPLLTTFHGPLLDVGRPNDVLQALGMTLAIQRGGLVSGVSPEVCADIESLGARDATLLPNVVSLSDGGLSDPPLWPPRRWLVVAREEKLGHLRAAVQLFAAFHEQFPGAHLVVASGSSPAQSRPQASAVVRLQRGLEVLGLRWCRAQGLPVWRALPAIHWAGYTAAPRLLARRSDLVLGMGRVVLESLAEGRPAVLVGYEHIHGLIHEARWSEQARSNFSGRGLRPLDVVSCVRDLTTSQPPILPASSRFVVAQPAARLLEIITATHDPATEAGQDMAKRVWGVLRAGRGQPKVFGEAAGRLGSREWECFFRLSRG